MSKVAWVVFHLFIATLISSGETRAALFDRDGKKLPEAEVNGSPVNWEFVRQSSPAQYLSTGKLIPKGCTAVLVEMGGPIYALTNGHCISKKSFERGSAPKIEFATFDRPESKMEISVKGVLYSSIYGTDLAVLQLDQSPISIRSLGLSPLRLRKLPPTVGESLTMVSVPQEGIDPRNQFPRFSRCQMDRVVDIGEDDYFFLSSLAHRCSAAGGSSGGPLISEKAEIVAITNTGWAEGGDRNHLCGGDNPCEILSSGRVINRVSNYAVPTSELATCFDDAGQFSLEISSCSLKAKTGPIASSPLELKPEALEKTLQTVRAQKEFPRLFANGDQLGPEAQYSPDVLQKFEQVMKQPEFQKLAAQVQALSEKVFSRNDIFSSFASDNIFPEMDVRLKTVFIDTSFLSIIQAAGSQFSIEAAWEFMLIHELCHYAFDDYTNLSLTGLSQHGFTSYLGQPSNIRYDDRIRQIKAMKHAEIDGLAIMVMRSLGKDYSVAPKVIRYLMAQYGDRLAPSDRIDPLIRIEAMEKLVRKLQ